MGSHGYVPVYIVTAVYWVIFATQKISDAVTVWNSQQFKKFFDITLFYKWILLITDIGEHFRSLSLRDERFCGWKITQYCVVTCIKVFHIALYM